MAKKQISRLKEPSLKCVDLVVSELATVIRESTAMVCSKSTTLCQLSFQLARYPRLRDEVERIVVGFIHERDQMTKNHLSMIIDDELAYMNTNHEDFIGFSGFVLETSFSLYIVFRAEAKAAQGQAPKKNLGNQVIRKGWLSVNNVNFIRGGKDCWFVLMNDSLSWYKDDEVLVVR